MVRRYSEFFSEFTKSLIKKIICYFGWRLIKLGNKPNLIKEDIQIAYLKSILASNGILHIGAHRGSEAPIYYWLGKPVIWIEANPKIYDDLQINISTFPNQKAFNYLISNKDFIKKSFFISNNDGASSSIFQFSKHHLNFENRLFKMNKAVKLETISLATFFKIKKLEPKLYNFWVIDVQGAELLALKGAKRILDFCKYLYVEVSLKDFYKGGVKFNNIKKWLEKRGFRILLQPKGVHTNVLFKNIFFKTTNKKR
jgi:FkbM family methyltransferase